MAITIVQAPGGLATPNTHYSVHSPLWFVVTSSNVAQPDFRFVFDVYSAGVVLLGRLKISPDALGQGVADVSQLIRGLLTNYYNPRGTAYSPFTMNTNSITVPYIIQFGEEYSNTVYPALTTDTYFAYNAYSGDTPGQFPDQPTTDVDHQFATSRPINPLTDIIYMPRDGRAFLSYLNAPEEDLIIEVQELDLYGEPNFFTGVKTSNVNTFLDKLVVLNLNLDYINLASFTPATPLSSTAPGYQIRVIRGDGVTFTDWVKVMWMCEAKTDATAVHFLNRYGAFDTYHFAGPTRKSVDLDRKEYQKIGAVLSSGLIREYDVSNNVYAETTVAFHTKHKWERKLSSGFVNDATHEWLWQLVASPQVYLEHNGYSYPVVIKTSRWQEKLTRFDKMYNLEIEIEMGRRVNSQSR